MATNVGLDIYNDNARNSKASKIREEIEESLQRLGTDYIDLYQVHWPDLDTPFEETFTELNKLREAGKARYIGGSNCTPEQMDEAAKYCPIVSAQPPYSLLKREIEKDVLPYCIEHDMGCLLYTSHLETYAAHFGISVQRIKQKAFTVLTPDTKNPYKQLYTHN